MATKTLTSTKRTAKEKKAALKKKRVAIKKTVVKSHVNMAASKREKIEKDPDRITSFKAKVAAKKTTVKKPRAKKQPKIVVAEMPKLAVVEAELPMLVATVPEKEEEKPAKLTAALIERMRTRMMRPQNHGGRKIAGVCWSPDDLEFSEVKESQTPVIEHAYTDDALFGIGRQQAKANERKVRLYAARVAVMDLHATYDAKMTIEASQIPTRHQRNDYHSAHQAHFFGEEEVAKKSPAQKLAAAMADTLVGDVDWETRKKKEAARVAHEERRSEVLHLPSGFGGPRGKARKMHAKTANNGAEGEKMIENHESSTSGKSAHGGEQSKMYDFKGGANGDSRPALESAPQEMGATYDKANRAIEELASQVCAFCGEPATKAKWVFTKPEKVCSELKTLAIGQPVCENCDRALYHLGGGNVPMAEQPKDMKSFLAQAEKTRQFFAKRASGNGNHQQNAAPKPQQSPIRPVVATPVTATRAQEPVKADEPAPAQAEAQKPTEPAKDPCPIPGCKFVLLKKVPFKNDKKGMEAVQGKCVCGKHLKDLVLIANARVEPEKREDMVAALLIEGKSPSDDELYPRKSAPTVKAEETIEPAAVLEAERIAIEASSQVPVPA